jgi:hypothetical protein
MGHERAHRRAAAPLGGGRAFSAVGFVVFFGGMLKKPAEVSGVARLFEKHLVERGFLTASQALDAIEEQMASRPPLGKLAIAAKNLTMHQVFEVVSEQAVGGRLFGETAVALGFLTPADVQELLKRQRELTPSLLDVLVARGVAARKVLAAEWEEHRRIRRRDFADVLVG